MEITSPAFEHSGFIPPTYTCDGRHINPPLRFTDVPIEAASLVLIMDDPDVPADIRSDGMWDHWIVFNIPPDIREIPEGTEPPGVHGTGTAGNSTYHGPCPPDGKHRYFFKLYALDSLLNTPIGSSKEDVEAAMEGHIIEQCELMGTYERQ